MKTIVVHIKVYNRNFFMVVSNSLGKLLFVKNSGIAGFKNTEKNSPEAISAMFLGVLKLIVQLKKNAIFLKLEGVPEDVLSIIYKQVISFFKKYKLYVVGFKVLNKIAHNGCRKKKKKK
jgi:ribosomal protein S11